MTPKRQSELQQSIQELIPHNWRSKTDRQKENDLNFLGILPKNWAWMKDKQKKAFLLNRGILFNFAKTRPGNETITEDEKSKQLERKEKEELVKKKKEEKSKKSKKDGKKTSQDEDVDTQKETAKVAGTQNGATTTTPEESELAAKKKAEEQAQKEAKEAEELRAKELERAEALKKANEEAEKEAEERFQQSQQQLRDLAQGDSEKEDAENSVEVISENGETEKEKTDQDQNGDPENAKESDSNKDNQKDNHSSSWSDEVDQEAAKKAEQEALDRWRENEKKMDKMYNSFKNAEIISEEERKWKIRSGCEADISGYVEPFNPEPPFIAHFHMDPGTFEMLKGSTWTAIGGDRWETPLNPQAGTKQKPPVEKGEQPMDQEDEIQVLSSETVQVHASDSQPKDSQGDPQGTSTAKTISEQPSAKEIHAHSEYQAKIGELLSLMEIAGDMAKRDEAPVKDIWQTMLENKFYILNSLNRLRPGKENYQKYFPDMDKGLSTDQIDEIVCIIDSHVAELQHKSKLSIINPTYLAENKRFNDEIKSRLRKHKASLNIHKRNVDEQSKRVTIASSTPAVHLSKQGRRGDTTAFLNQIAQNGGVDAVMRDPLQNRFSLPKESSVPRSTISGIYNNPNEPLSGRGGFRNDGDNHEVLNDSNQSFKSQNQSLEEKLADTNKQLAKLAEMLASGSHKDTPSANADRSNSSRSNGQNPTNLDYTSFPYNGNIENPQRHYTSWANRSGFQAAGPPNVGNYGPPPNPNNGFRVGGNHNRHQIDPYMPEEWYLDNFTGPWQVVPDPAGDQRERTEVPDVRGITVFKGQKDRYYQWRSKIISLVHTHCTTWKKKLMAILKTLDDEVPEVRACIPNSDPTPFFYIRLVSNLEKRFGGDDRHIDHLFDLLRSCPVQTKPNFKALDTLLCKANSLYEQLILTNRFDAGNDRNMFKEIKSRLCETWRHEYLASRHTRRNGQCVLNGDIPLTTRSLIDFLETKLEDHRDDVQLEVPVVGGTFIKATPKLASKAFHEAMEEGDTEDEDTEHDHALYGGSGKGPKNIRSGKPKSCSCCGRDHFLTKCEKFKTYTHDQKWAVLRSGNHCSSCLSTRHFKPECPSKKPCSKCEALGITKFHHVIIHKDPPKTFVHADENEAMEVDEHQGSFSDQYSDDDEVCALANTPKGGQLSRDTLSLAIIPVLLRNPQNNMTVEVNALLDDGSQRSFVTAEIANKLDMKGICVSFQSQGVGGVVSHYEKALKGELAVKGIKEGKLDPWSSLPVRVLPDVVGGLIPIDWSLEKKKWNHLKNIPVNPIQPKDGVHLLIGVKNSELLCALEKDVVGPRGGPVARRTKMGWVIFGAIDEKTRQVERTFLSKENVESHINAATAQMNSIITDDQIASTARYCVEEEDGHVFLCHHFERLHFQRNPSPEMKNVKAFATKAEVLDRDLNYQFEKQMELERIPDEEEKALSLENKYAKNLIERSMLRLEGGQFQVGCLWRKGEPTLKSNRELAEKRHRNLMTSKAMQRPEVRKEFKAVIDGWLSDNYVRKVPISEESPPNVWYLPIFGVTKFDRDTTKVRVVADARAEYKGRSLNGSMLAGPCLIREVSLTLARFRRFSVAVIGDVSRMFLCVALDPKDRPYHRFLYHDDPKADPEEYEFLVHCFGNAGSPTIAIYVVQAHAQTKIDECARAVETVMESTHVDDTSDSFETEAEAIEVMQFLKTKIYGEIQMNLRKFASNSEEVMKSFPQEDWASNYELIGNNTKLEMPTKAVLGVSWNTEKDVLTFPGGKFGFQITEPLTKRILLKETAKIFDPIGIASPVVVAARMLIQKCWVHELPWDVPVPSSIESLWNQWREGSQDWNKYEIPRVLMPTRKAKIKGTQLHCFCDASGDAYCAVIYIRVEYDDGFVYINLVASKTRLTPTKKPSMARLELEAAKLGALLTKAQNKILKIPDVRMWSDSMNVLGWLRTSTKALKMYVNNRVESILSSTEASQWEYINTKENPADIGSRGCTMDELSESQLWKVGPEFLKLPEEQWPKSAKELSISQEVLDDDGRKELKESTFTHVLASSETKYELEVNKGWSFLETTSSWLTILRIAARVVRCAYKWLQKIRPKEKYELEQVSIHQKSQKLVWREIQEQHFPEERGELLRANRVKQTSKILQLRAYLDPEGIIRCSSRTALSDILPHDQKFPIILPKDSSAVKSLIRYYHSVILEHNGGHAHLLSEMQQKFWLVNGRTQCKSITSNCVLCKRARRTPEHQVQGELPVQRIPDSKTAPFAHTILDAAGPFLCTQRRATVKRYIIVFSCMIYRALHLEVVHELSMDGFLMAFDRFTARRGIPEYIRSDNGTNFRAASSELRELWKFWDESALSRRGYSGIKWQFAAPLAPHTQGAVERMVQLVKRGLVTKLANQSWNEEVLETVTVKLEGILNSRPLTYVSTDIKDSRALTPNSFLLPLTSRELGPIAEVDGVYLKKKWKQVNQILDSLWSFFVKEIVPTLHKNTMKEANVLRRNVQEGDVVALLEEKHRGLWPLARVVRVVSDDKGVVRFADVVLINVKKDKKDFVAEMKLRNRHINKLMLLIPKDLDKEVKERAPDKETPVSSRTRSRAKAIKA